MIRDRVISVWNKVGYTAKELEALTGIDRYKWGNVKSGKQRITEDQIETFCKLKPEYALWIAIGKTAPEAGQISPELENTAKEYGKTGTDTD